MEVTIKNQTIELKFRFKQDLLFESATEESFSGKNTKQWIIYMFCSVIANAGDGFMSFDEFERWLSDNPQKFYDFIEEYTKFMANIAEQRAPKKADESKKKKK